MHSGGAKVLHRATCREWESDWVMSSFGKVGEQRFYTEQRAGNGKVIG